MKTNFGYGIALFQFAHDVSEKWDGFQIVSEVAKQVVHFFAS